MNCQNYYRAVSGYEISIKLPLTNDIPGVFLESTPERDWIKRGACDT